MGAKIIDPTTNKCQSQNVLSCSQLHDDFKEDIFADHIQAPHISIRGLC